MRTKTPITLALNSGVSMPILGLGVFDFELTADEVASVDELDTGVHAVPDPATVNMTTYPKRVEN